jgi:hypothetical protein
VTQHPLLQVLPAQHGAPVEVVAPGVPQATQREFLHTALASLQALLAQQGPPVDPQTVQILLLLSQTVPGSLHAGPVDV